MPAKTDLDAYECHHGMGYSTFRSSKNDLQAELTAFVPVGKNCEINQLTLTNNSKETKDFSVFSYVEFCLWNAMDDMTNFQRNFSTGEVEVHGSAIYHKTEYRERRNHYALYDHGEEDLKLAQFLSERNRGEKTLGGRLYVDEELVRLHSHYRDHEVRSLMAGSSIGRKLNFFGTGDKPRKPTPSPVQVANDCEMSDL